MLEKILLFCSTYSKQLLLDATLIESTDPIQPWREGESFAAYGTLVTDTVKPLCVQAASTPPAHPTGHGLGWDRCFFWDSGRESLGGPCAGRDSLLSKWPQIPKENPLEGRGAQRQLVPPWALGSRRWHCNQSWGGRAAGEEGTPWHMCSCQQCQLGREGGRCLSFHHGSPAHPSYCRWLSGARQNGGQVWDVLWSSCHLPPTTTQLRAREEQLCLCTYVTHQTYQRSNVTTISMNKVGQSQPWGKQEPSHWL